MVVSMIQFIIELPDVTSIKEKRRIVHSVRDRLIRKYKLSVAEVDLLDSLAYSQIGAALVSNSKRYGETVMHKVLAFLEDECEGRLHDVQIISEQY
ncbi:MAG: DUF503 domain-containing protein [Spirochaetaceae bacterium]|nr:MAG: DUF503 domain-containing protein [Spirochaetaceae bacterium]